MSAAIAIPGNTASTILTHFFGSGLSDDRYVIERFRLMIDGDIRRCPDPAPVKGKDRSRANYATATLKAVREMGPARTEIIVCTGIRTRGGIQIWGDIASGLFHDRRQKTINRPFGGIGVLENRREDIPRDALDIAGLKVLGQHGRDHLVVGAAANRGSILGPVDDRPRAEKRG